ncbi:MULTISPECIES: nucleoside triphosphate pyrophosphohydrolase [Methylococcus]|uniref:Nucleoside triphosphate pyrophosphohydrolase n=1 Tax=Methylococcus capsulatus (strain ATCC 33009 / NCIMB 11132 / Bath) TaxID=243233 RepID=Q60CT6_METCA|nr:nucleoside triphosphate pyrophosphohydrolase [Methylococcus capsulatus]AAU90819.1 MazG family protein [Methylococcus capsulatus str. Bath]QXP86451.1 nucleoside triphosphate pyrophosphohydrolase [Methylococcus capsulatus]QXP89332.1 nucleoside triphosphate pyrophosphohydrolase [Methylococcus capsulatus]QXP93881.1 nucleoside triphosphate pyrophosphohydrolase [Methylococcus capsulatus]UQN11396.1 nucleoside triphosphate pyrophosphohydrolase [Methylococcus capsulatus]
MQQTRRLLDIMARLRDPDTGCPWDLRQDFASLVPYTLEEAYEVADAIERGDFTDLRDELGDLLLQVAFHSRMAEERGLFDFEAVAAAIADKLERRHPHVFAGIDFASDAERLRHWETSKLEERSEKNGQTGGSVLEGVATALPALMEAHKLQKRAARHGFDWDASAAVLSKVREELDELEQAVASGDTAHVREEMGDLLFALVNLARHLDVDAETALREGNRKFRRRFRFIEDCVSRSGKRLTDCTLAELDAFWDEAKRAGH